VKAERTLPHAPTGKQVGIDVGLKSFYTDSEGNTVANPRYLRKAEKHLKRLHRCVSRKKKGSKNRKKAIKKLAKGYLKVQRQRQDFARKTARALILSSDMIAYEDWQRLPISSRIIIWQRASAMPVGGCSFPGFALMAVLPISRL
jgi:putative transposase